jgi:hypothetical protein
MDDLASRSALPFPAWPLTPEIWPIHSAETSLKPGSVQTIALSATNFSPPKICNGPELNSIDRRAVREQNSLAAVAGPWTTRRWNASVVSARAKTFVNLRLPLLDPRFLFRVQAEIPQEGIRHDCKSSRTRVCATRRFEEREHEWPKLLCTSAEVFELRLVAEVCNPPGAAAAGEQFPRTSKKLIYKTYNRREFWAIIRSQSGFPSPAPWDSESLKGCSTNLISTRTN